MYSRVTLLEIDTVRYGLEEAICLFEEYVAPGLRQQDGFEGVLVLATPDGKGMILTLWDTAEAAADASGFASRTLERYMMLFTAPPGREQYKVMFSEMPGALVG